VNTESEHSAEKAGITVEDSKNLTLPEIDPTWKYNVGREALAPNFSRYKNLDREALSAVKEKYRAGMEGAKIPRGELKKLKDAMITGDYRSDKKRPVNFHISTLEKKRQEALGIDDCKVMATGERIYHSFRKKGDKTLPDKNFDGVYKNLQSPEMIYEEIHSRHGEEGRVFHFITETRGGKIINAVLQKRNGMALRVITIDLGEMKDIKAAGDLKEITY
jgi:hypothetical protein